MTRHLLPLLLLLSTQAHAGETFEELQRYWSMELGAGFELSADITGNVRDIARPYASGDVASDLPLGGGFFFRNVLRYPLGKASPALLARIAYANTATSGALDTHGDYTRGAERLEVLVGPGVCVDDHACLFATFGWRHVGTFDDNYPITNLAAALGNSDEFTVDSFTAPYLGAIIGETLVNGLLSTVDFDNQRVAIDVTDDVVMQGGMLATVIGAGQRITVDGGVGYFVLHQIHTATTRVTKDVADAPDDVTSFDYDWEKGLGAVGIDLGTSIGLLPDRFPVQLALGLRGSLVALVDLDRDRSVGTYVFASGFLSAKW
ncbi:MAG: hypothetical protein H6732_02035 [Alphaproteobacteria bacterium]|nr:hypothetical protein [Alphaproteobacteria bacterium]